MIIISLYCTCGCWCRCRLGGSGAVSWLGTHDHDVTRFGNRLQRPLCAVVAANQPGCIRLPTLQAPGPTDVSQTRLATTSKRPSQPIPWTAFHQAGEEGDGNAGRHGRLQGLAIYLDRISAVVNQSRRVPSKTLGRDSWAHPRSDAQQPTRHDAFIMCFMRRSSPFIPALDYFPPGGWP